MRIARRLSAMALLASLSIALVWPAGADVALRNTSGDRTLLLDQNTDYLIQNVNITGVRDSAAVTMAGKIKSVKIRKSTFGNVRAGETGKAVGMEAAGATVTLLQATDSVFFDCENQLMSLKEGSFGLVTFERCTFRASEQFLKEVYSDNPWRDWPPVTEFCNIDRLELLDSKFENTIILIHPSVKKVVIRGEVPGLHIQDKDATQVIRLSPADDPGAGETAPVVVARK